VKYISESEHKSKTKQALPLLFIQTQIVQSSRPTPYSRHCIAQKMAISYNKTS
jgi:hypothetical protein